MAESVEGAALKMRSRKRREFEPHSWQFFLLLKLNIFICIVHFSSFIFTKRKYFEKQKINICYNN